jgi:hypothetical protein
MLDSFSKHVQGIYQLDMFYGDETLKYLMEHAAGLNEQIEQNFEYIYSLTEEAAVEEIDIAEEEETVGEKTRA